MKKIIALVATLSLAAAVPVHAKEVTLTLNEQEQQALAHVLDQATRSGGLAATQGTVYFYNKLQQAISAANAPTPEPVKAPDQPTEPAK